jgi:carboxylesterase
MRKVVLVVVVFVLIGLAIGVACAYTGFMQYGDVDDRDLERWDYCDGIICGADEFFIEGGNDTCWILVHSYSATPLEMRPLAERINVEFGDSVLGVRLNGHGGVPSELYDLNLDDWYSQVEEIFIDESSRCESVNIIGSSFGGAIALRLAQEYEVGNLFILNAYVYPVWPGSNLLLKIFSPIFHYVKKGNVARINDPEGLDNHVAYLNFVFSPVSGSSGFLNKVFSSSYLISEDILIQHSTKDEVADFSTLYTVFNLISSNNKELVSLSDSNHILLADYDSDVVIENIIDFETRFR